MLPCVRGDVCERRLAEQASNKEGQQHGDWQVRMHADRADVATGAVAGGGGRYTTFPCGEGGIAEGNDG